MLEDEILEEEQEDEYEDPIYGVLEWFFGEDAEGEYNQRFGHYYNAEVY